MTRDVGDSWREVYDNMDVSTDAHDSRECPACGYDSISDTFGEPSCDRCDWSRTRKANKKKGSPTR